MSDEIPLPDAPEGPVDNTPTARTQARLELINYLNGLTQRTLNSLYPQAEVASWDIQKAEAERVMAKGETATLADAPFLARVCFFHHGEGDDTARLIQVKEKAAAVASNAAAWAEAAAFVNGLRARTEKAFEAATSPGDVLEILRLAKIDTETFRSMSGL